jgi:hypothetical protein
MNPTGCSGRVAHLERSAKTKNQMDANIRYAYIGGEVVQVQFLPGDHLEISTVVGHTITVEPTNWHMKSALFGKKIEFSAREYDRSVNGVLRLDSDSERPALDRVFRQERQGLVDLYKKPFSLKLSGIDWGIIPR